MPIPPPGADAGPVIDTVTSINPEAPPNMDRQQMIDALQQLGYDTSLITDTIPDAALAEILRVYEANSAPAEGEPAPGGSATPMDDGTTPAKKPEDMTPVDPNAPVDPNDPNAQPVQQYDDAAPTRDEIVQFLVDAGAGDQATLSAMPDDQLQELFLQVVQSMQGDQGAAPAAPPDDTAAQMAEKVKKMSERAYIKSIVTEAIAQALKGVDAKLNAVTGQADRLIQNQKKADVVKFCEARRLEGKLLPAEFNDTVARLIRADSRKVRKFSEGGKQVLKSELDLQMEELERRPIVVSFAERLKQPLQPGNDELAQVESHYEKFSEGFARAGTTKEKFVKAYQLLKKRDPHLTAADYCAGNR